MFPKLQISTNLEMTGEIVSLRNRCTQILMNNRENLGRFDPSARWTWGEEFKLIRKMDFRIMSCQSPSFIGN